jgi:hypothetical protein
MKCLKINAPINLKTGETVNNGGIVVIIGVGYEIKNKTNSVKATIQTELYKSQNSFTNNKDNIDRVQDFNSTFRADISYIDYDSIKAEKLVIDIVKAQLDLVYPTFIEIINL